MENAWSLSLALLTVISVAHGIPWAGPTHTVRSGDADIGWTLRPTDGPQVPQKIGELKRDLQVAPNTCGWVNGDLGSAWTVAGPTCFWYSDIQIVNGWTSCVDYGQTGASCGSDCSLVHTCNAASPYCGSVYFPSGYRGYGNCNAVAGMTYNVELYYTGLNQNIDLPIFTGANGISTGTQNSLGEAIATTSATEVAKSSPPGQQPISSTSISTASSATSSAPAKSFVLSTSAIGSAESSIQAQSTRSPTTTNGSSNLGSLPTSTSPGSSSLSSSSTPIGAIVGGVVGGLAVIGMVLVAILWILRSKRKAPVQESSSGATGPIELDLNEQKVSVQPGIHEMKQPEQHSYLAELGTTYHQPELPGSQAAVYYNDTRELP
ncbi:uncharacterized protein LY89DRAFT_723670 [Mollisia scopiformis]|uniref:Uncharacterized protein n=1 Tax=Mollisia scopiformis TaxID=149040 RepID=A0A132BF31_MOLSC|nr:uncharacterized protein LY89DRAFT_723670 [Mollisia scopiformis]KUJ10474.1 hypothetical protein LY89DRAFT_723670 [Mollisia scopiformis]